MKKSWLAIVVAAVFAVACGTASALPIYMEFGPNLVVNGGFETGDLTGWTQSGNTGFTSVVASNPHSGAYALHCGPVDALGFISQDLATIPGATYNIHLWFDPSASSPGASILRVDWDGATVYNQVGMPNVPYTEIVIDPVATSSLTTLSIGFQNNPSFDDIDDISVFQTVIPEPMTLSLLGLGLAGIGILRRKTK